MSAAERLQPAVAAAEPLFSARDLTRLYGPEKGCQGVSFDLYPGEVLGIVGESGSGKSSIARALTGLARFSGAKRSKTSAAPAQKMSAGMSSPGRTSSSISRISTSAT